MPTTLLPSQTELERFRKALIAIGGSVTRTVPVDPFVVVKYKLPKHKKSSDKKLDKPKKPLKRR